MRRGWRKKVIAEARTWIGTPYHSGARLKQIGVDCGQLLIGVYAGAGIISDIDTGHYPFDWHLHRSEELYLSWVQKYCDITTDDPKPGDIAVFCFGRCVSHAGIVAEWPRMIHSYVGMGVIESNINEAILCKNNGESRLVGVYRVRGE